MIQAPIVFVRHGETGWNAIGRHQGHRDIPLNDKGRGQARRNGMAVAEKFPDVAEFDFVASPLIRARETMEIVRTALGFNPAGYQLDERIKEIHYGAWEGFTDDELAACESQMFTQRQADLWRFVLPGGESYEILSKRVSDWLTKLERPTLVVAHGGVGRVMRHQLLGLDPQSVLVGVFPQDKVFRWQNGTESVF
jgi:broad specificity phosphatase PhoE